MANVVRDRQPAQQARTQVRPAHTRQCRHPAPGAAARQLPRVQHPPPTTRPLPAAMPRILVVTTADLADGGRALTAGLRASAVPADAVSVDDSYDLSAALLRAGRARPPYDAAVVLANVDRSLEGLVVQSVNNAAVAVSLPAVIKVGPSPDIRSILARVMTITGIAGAGGGGGDAGAGGAGGGGAMPAGVAASGAATAAMPPSDSGAVSAWRSAAAAGGASPGGLPPPGMALTRVAPAIGEAVPLNALRGGKAVSTAKRALYSSSGVAGALVPDADSRPAAGAPPPGERKPGRAHVPAAGAAAAGPSWARPYAVDARPDVRSDVTTGAGGAAGLANADPTLAKLIYSLRETLIKYGGAGIAAVGRKFAIVDNDGSRSVSAEEFVVALREMGLSYPKEDVARLFAYFDHDGTGTIDYDELLVGLRGELNDARRALVVAAFRSLDTNGDGVATVEDVVGRFNASKHPDVIRGRKRPEEVLREFLDGFDGGSRDGRVTLQEFERYYATLSAYIDRDDYFELMMRNCWHLSGGTGWSANTTNRRVLVTRRDGSQVVEEVPDDLGATNATLIKKALVARGVDVVAVSLYGGDGDSVSLTDGSAPAPAPAPAPAAARSRLGAAAAASVTPVPAPSSIAAAAAYGGSARGGGGAWGSGAAAAASPGYGAPAPAYGAYGAPAGAAAAYGAPAYGAPGYGASTAAAPPYTAYPAASAAAAAAAAPRYGGAPAGAPTATGSLGGTAAVLSPGGSFASRPPPSLVPTVPSAAEAGAPAGSRPAAVGDAGFRPGRKIVGALVKPSFTLG